MSVLQSILDEALSQATPFILLVLGPGGEDGYDLGGAARRIVVESGAVGGGPQDA